MKVLVIAPHPDDEVLGCGGTIARHVADGDRVDVAIITKGDLRYNQKWIALSREEAMAAHDLLGVTWTFFLDFPSPTLDQTPQTELIDALRRFSDYQTVYLPDRNDLHQEHAQVFEASCVAFRPPGPDLYAYETLSETECGFGFVPDRFVDITSYLTWKLAAFSQFQTQRQKPPSPRSLAGIRALAQTRGFTVHCSAAEAFRTVRTVWGANDSR